MRAVQASLFCGLLALASAAKRPTLVSHGYAAHMNPAVMPLEGCHGDCDLDSHCKAGKRALAWLSTPKLCAVRCEQLTLLNRHFSDSDGGADGTVGKLSVMRVWWCCTSDFT